MDEIVQLIQHTPYALQTKLPSYARIFNDNSVGSVAFVHKLLTIPRTETTTKISSGGDGLNDTDLDLTGSPLTFSIYSIKCEDTILSVAPRSWLAEEENHSPLTVQEARTLISRYFLKSQSSKNVPLWVVCNGLDQHTTLLFAGQSHNGWYTRTTVRLCGLCNYDSSNMQPAILKKKHFDLAVDTGQQCTKTEVLCTYSIFESNKLGAGGEPFAVDSNMKVCVELTWNVATLEVPVDGAVATVIVQVNVGHECSEALAMWQQLVCLQKCTRALDMARSNRSPPVFPHKEVTQTGVMERLPELLRSAEYGARTFHRQAPQEETCKLRQVLEEDQRELDLTDRLWLLLTDCRDTQELIDCLEHVFHETQQYRTRPYLRPKNQTSVAKTVMRLMKGESASTELIGSRALEMLIEMGLEKLAQDFIFIFLRAGLLSLDPVLKELVTTENRFCSVVSLARLHASLELLLVAQAHLDLPCLTMDALAKQTLDGCTARIASFEALQTERLVTLRAPVGFQDVHSWLPLHFTSWRLTLSTEGEQRKVTSVFLCNTSFIFPPSIYIPNGPVLNHNATVVEEQFYCFQLSSWSDKLR